MKLIKRMKLIIDVSEYIGDIFRGAREFRVALVRST